MGDAPWSEAGAAVPSPVVPPDLDELDRLLRPAPHPFWATSWRDRWSPDAVRRVRWAVAALVVAGLAVWGLVGAGSGGGGVPVELPRAAGSGSAPGSVSASASLPRSAAATSSTAPSSTAAGPAVVAVHVAGAVGAPGVVQVPGGARWADAVAAAGGAAPDADLDRVNLAAPVVDGARLFVPLQGSEPPAVVAVEGAAGGAGGATGATGDDGTSGAPAAPIDLNTATAEQLDTLPGVGPATAAAILQHRERNGRFRSVDELQDVSGIGPARFERLAPLVVVAP